MSSIKTTQIDGDVSIGRNVAIGGRATVQGSAYLKGNVKVEGWLDARNIKGANKGVFTTVEKLRTAYPIPHDGWWAIVGTTLPGPIYIGDGGEWVATGKEGGAVTVDMEQYNVDVTELRSDVSQLQTDVNSVESKNAEQDTKLADLESGQESAAAEVKKIGDRATALEERTGNLETASQTAATGLSDLKEQLNTLGDNVEMVSGTASRAKTQAESVASDLEAFKSTKGAAGGLAPLDEKGKVPAGNLRSDVYDVRGFSAFVGVATVTNHQIDKSDADSGCTVVYSSEYKCFLLRVVTTENGAETETYYSDWQDGEFWGESSNIGRKPVRGKLYVNSSDYRLYLWDGTDLTPTEIALRKSVSELETKVGTLEEEAIEAKKEIQIRNVVNVNQLLGLNGRPVTFAVVLEKISDLADAPDYMRAGVVLTFYTDKGWQSKQWTTTGSGSEADFLNEDNWTDFGGGQGTGGAFNPSAEDGRTYVLCDMDDTANSAVHVAKNKGQDKLGLLLTFALKKGTWKTYQFVGSNTGDAAWYDTDNWKDFGSMVQGSEAMIDIDSLVPLSTGYYTLGTALSALKSYQESTGVNYQKRGIVISYAVEANKVETKQYQGDSALTGDFWENSLWQDFGSKLIASDIMEDGGTDAFSTGGAYKMTPTEIEATEEVGSVSLRLKNKAGDTLSETQFSVGTGTGGGGGGTTVAISFEDDPYYVRAGGTAILKAAIRSVTQLADGSSLDNKITSVVFTNRTTKTVVASFKPNQASSSSLKAYSFEFDLSTIAVNAGSVELQAVATDVTGRTATRNVQLVAVDVTVESCQTLNYTKDTSLQVGGVKVSIPMYRFPHNASDKGIQTKIEIYKNGAWEVLDNVLIRDTYTHNVTIDPTGLGHGAYPLRIQGTDVASGIEGNILHTAVMVVEQRESVSDYTKPIVVARWYDDGDGKVKLFQTITFDVACYQRDNANPVVAVSVTDVTKGTTETVAGKMMNRSSYYACEKRIVGYSDGDTLRFDAVCGKVSMAEKLSVVISGSLLSVSETEGAYYKIGFEGRSNSDTDKSIKTTASDNSEVSIAVKGSNYSTNGFVADNFGTEQSSGRMSLRVAENVTAECSDRPFASNTIPTNGLALSLTFKVKNIAKRDAQIIKCMSDRLGFVLTGEKFIVSTNGDSEEALKNVQTTAATSYLDDTVYRIDIVVEPQARAPYSGVMLCKVYQNGDESACVPINVSNGFPAFEDTIHFDGTDADLYLYGITRWNSYYDFIQAFNNYIMNLTDTSAMLTEFEQNQVMVDVTAEGTTKPRPDMQKLLDRGVMVVVETRTADSNLSKDGSAVTDSAIYYPDYIEGIKDKKTSVLMDWYIYFPDREWANCKVEAVPTTNQGTSTLAYAIKNKKANFKKSKGITLLNTREYISEKYNGDEAILAKYDDAAKLAKKKKIRVKEGSTPIDTITIKVDYSDSAGANNCALMELMNDVQIALGNDYMTPAQRYNTNKDENFKTSIDGVTCALFRTDYKIGQDKGVEAATLPENAYFHSKANFNADKGNPHFFGFEDVEGYNLGCVNYGDFKEMVAPRGTDIDDYKAQVLSDTSSLAPGTLYMLSEFCGPKTRFLENDGTGSMAEIGEVAVDGDHTLSKTLAEVQADDVNNYDWGEAYKTGDGKFVQYKGGKWKDTTGTMTFDTATQKWSITGRVLNPVECYEYRQYQEFCWQQGVNSVDDMLKSLHTDDGDVPIWSTYYEMRYPDDDDLNALYASGQKVPYQLYRELAFCQQCNQNLSEDAAQNAAKDAGGSEKVFNGAGASTTITLDGKTVEGTKENRLLKWQHEMHKYFSPQSNNCYIVASDYKATVDQRAKNMMIAVYKEADGNMRYYFNHWYDGDSVDEADNDCYLTIPWDMDGSSSHLYQGWDGVMFRQTYALFEKGEGVWLDDSGKETLTLHDTAAAMRATKTSTEQDIFSADGCYRYWMTERILKWPKVVSSFDGERKYIETATAADNHYPALHGLRLDSLPAFQRKRFAYRDGYFQCGDLFKQFFQARMMGAITVKITAAQDGYFGMGVDSTSSAKYACYLKAGESHTFTDAAAGEGGKLIYIFGADKLSALDISGCTPKNSNWMIADCTLLRKLVIGGTDYNPEYTNDILSALSLGRMPFLEEIDIRNTKILTLDASGCPRLRSVLAEGSLLQTMNVAEASPIATLHLPSTMTDLRFVNLPKLAYGTGGGLVISGFDKVKTLTVSDCPGIDVAKMLDDIVDGGAMLTGVSISEINTTGKYSVLEALREAGTIGLNSEEKIVCDGLSGRWIMSALIEEENLNTVNAYFPNLEVLNLQYSEVVFDDTNNDSQNMTNPENGTSGAGYVASGHFLKIRDGSHAYKCTYDKSDGHMDCQQLSDTNYKRMADGTAIDTADSKGVGYDIMKRLQPYWYKGVNDFKNQRKHLFASSLDSEPLSTATKRTRKKLSELLKQSSACIYTRDLKVGDSYEIVGDANDNLYELDVEGMKQVRWPGLNSTSIGAVFVDADDKVVGVFTMSVSSAQFDFVPGDYVFCDVPVGAKKILFVSPKGFDEEEAIAVDSDVVEAIEPDWVHTKDRLVGVYGMTVDGLKMPRSVSGQRVVVGDGIKTTNAEWRYDGTGKVVNTSAPTSDMHYTAQDILNLCELRGTGYQGIDYEMSKDIANLAMALVGDRDIQAQCGYGCYAAYIAGSDNADNFGNVTRRGVSSRNLGNIIFGLQNFAGCGYEWMDNVAVNVKSYAQFKANKRIAGTDDPVNAVWHIYDPVDRTERTVQGVTSSGYCVGRVKFGRYADVICSKFTSDNGRWNMNYSDMQMYASTAGSVVGRAGNSYGSGGLVLTVANSASSYSHSEYGGRLAFVGKIVIVDKSASKNA